MSHAACLEKLIHAKSTDIVVKTTFGGILTVRSLIETTLAGASIIVNHDPFTPELFFELVERFKVNHAYASPHFMNLLLKNPKIETANLSSLRLLIIGGSHIPHDLTSKLTKYLGRDKFGYAYGMTELAGLISLNIYHKRDNSVGQLVDRYEAKIIDEDGNRLGINEDGELHVRLPCPFLGYLGDDQNQNNYDNEGFFATGDIAHFDASGNLFIVDRKKEMFKSNGRIVTPNEIEAFVNQMDGIKISCVVGIPNTECGYLTAAVIEKHANGDCTEETISNAVTGN